MITTHLPGLQFLFQKQDFQSILLQQHASHNRVAAVHHQNAQLQLEDEPYPISRI